MPVTAIANPRIACGLFANSTFSRKASSGESSIRKICRYCVAGRQSSRAGGWINIAAGIAGFAASIYLVWFVLTHGAIQMEMFYVDAFNVYLIALTSLVGMTTAIFSRPYMAHELHIHRVTPARLRLRDR